MNYIYTLLIVYIVFMSLIAWRYVKRKNQHIDFKIWFSNNIKLLKILSVSILILTTILFLLRFRFYSIYECTINGWAYNTNTEYSWIKNQCLYTTSTGAKLPFGVTRDRPDGKNDLNQHNDDIIE